MKFLIQLLITIITMVTPYAGVWIEILYNIYEMKVSMVTPYAGVWIEIRVSPSSVIKLWSLPTRECGLKCDG